MYLFQAFFKTTDNEMQLNPKSKKNNFLLISYKLADISTYILMSLRRKPVPKKRRETLGLLKQKFVLAPLSYFSKMSIDHEMANHIASDTSAHYDRQKHLQCYPILQSLTHINPHHTHTCSYTQKNCERLTCE